MAILFTGRAASTRCIFLTLLLCLCQVDQAGAGLSLITTTATFLTSKEEERLGDEFMQNVAKQLRIVDDPDITQYVEQIGRRIVAQQGGSAFKFHFYVVDDNTLNAFAAPAGHVFIYRGLMALMNSDEELAGILSHEVSHVFCRHIAKLMEQDKKISVATIAGVLASVFVGGGAAVGSAMLVGSLAGESAMLKYSRENEREADEMGLKYLAGLGYGGEGLLTILDKIRDKRWFGENDIPTYWSTHPALEERMAYLDTYIHARPSTAQVPAKRAASIEFSKAQARLTALFGDISVAKSTFDARLIEDPADWLALYGKGLTLGREGNHSLAREFLEKASKLRPKDESILRELGKSALQLGDHIRAMSLLTRALAISPDDTEARFILGRAQIEAGDLPAAEKSLRQLAHASPPYLKAIYHLGEVYGKQGNEVEAHYYLGLFYKEKGDAKNAFFHFSRALKLSSKESSRAKEIQQILSDIPPVETDDAAKNPKPSGETKFTAPPGEI